MTVPAAIERGPGTGASDTPGPSRAQKASSPEPPCKAVWFPYRTACRSRGADISPVPGEHLRHLVSQGSRPRPTKRHSLERRRRRHLAPALSCQGWRAICRAVPVESDPQRRHPPDQPSLTGPECGGKSRDTSVPAVRTGELGEHRRCCRRNGAEAPH